MTMRRGILIPRTTWAAAIGDQQRRWAMSAALMAFPKGHVSHESAAFLLGLPSFAAPAVDSSGIPAVHLTRVGAARTEGWIRVHGCDTPPQFVTTIDGLAATDLARTSIELAAGRSQRWALAMIDAAMRIAIISHAGSANPREAARDPHERAWARRRWREATAPYARHRWVTTVRRAIDLADPAAESVLESMSRWSIVDSGLPRPECGLPVRGDNGVFYFADMVWEESQVIGEADGLAKYDSREALLKEKVRQEALEAMGWRFVRWGWREGVTDSSIMVARIGRALSERPRRPGLS